MADGSEHDEVRTNLYIIFSDVFISHEYLYSWIQQVNVCFLQNKLLYFFETHILLSLFTKLMDSNLAKTTSMWISKLILEICMDRINLDRICNGFSLP